MDRPVLDVKSKLFFFLLQLSLKCLVGPPDRLALEQTVHLLQRDTAGLGDEEEGEEEGEEGEGCEKEVNPIAHSLEHLLGEPRDKEVEQPVAGRCAGLGQGAEVRVKEFLLGVLLVASV